MSILTDPTYAQRLLSLSDREICDRFTYRGTPTLNLTSLGIGKSDHILVNNGSIDDVALLTVCKYCDIISNTLPSLYKSERALAERMEGLIEIHRTEEAGGGAAYPTGQQDLDLRTFFIETAANLAVIKRRLYMLSEPILPSVAAADASPGTISLLHCINWAQDAVDALIKELTQRADVVDDIEEEIAVICNIRVRTAQTFREMSAQLSQAMDNGIGYTDLLNLPPAWASAAD